MPSYRAQPGDIRFVFEELLDTYTLRQTLPEGCKAADQPHGWHWPARLRIGGQGLSQVLTFTDEAFAA